MKKYKRRKKRVYIFKLIFFIFVACVVVLPFFKVKKPALLPIKKYDINDFTFTGTFESSYAISDKYSQIIYKNNTKNESHFVNLENGKEEDYKVFIKDGEIDNFNNKILELLKLKYPKSYAHELINSNRNYTLDEEYLLINFEPENLSKKREYSLIVYYNEIKDYLSFSPKIITDYVNEDGFNYDPKKTTIIITYDDGPSGDNTQKLIDALEDYKMSATFFMQGFKLENGKDTVLKVYKSHSEVGYHSYAHKYFTKQSSKDIQSEFALSNEIFNKITGDSLKLTRPPYGNYNQMVLDSIDNAFIRWNIDTNDWRYKDVNHISNEILNNIKDGNIILMHDSYHTTVEASIKVFKKLYDDDIQVLSVSNYAKLKGINLKNHEVYFNLKKN